MWSPIGLRGPIRDTQLYLIALHYQIETCSTRGLIVVRRHLRFKAYAVTRKAYKL